MEENPWMKAFLLVHFLNLIHLLYIYIYIKSNFLFLHEAPRKSKDSCVFLAVEQLQAGSGAHSPFSAAGRDGLDAATKRMVEKPISVTPGCAHTLCTAQHMELSSQSSLPASEVFVWRWHREPWRAGQGLFSFLTK